MQTLHDKPAPTSVSNPGKLKAGKALSPADYNPQEPSKIQKLASY